MLWWNWNSLWLLADRLPLRVHRVRQQWLQMEGGCPESVSGVLWTTWPREREGMQYVAPFHFTDCHWLFVLFTFVGLPRSVIDVLSFPELSFPSNPTFCLLEMWSRGCLCSEYMQVTVCYRHPFLLIHKWGTSMAAPPEDMGLLVLSCPALQFIYSCIGQNGDQEWSNYICIVSTFSLLSLLSWMHNGKCLICLSYFYDEAPAFYLFVNLFFSNLECFHITRFCFFF